MSVAEDPTAAPPARRLPWLIIVSLAALVLLPLAAWEWPREKQRWQVARAVEAHEEGHLDDALTAIDEILRENPENLAVLLLRAQWLLEKGDGNGALADVEAACKLNEESVSLLFVRSQTLIAVGRYEDGVRDADALVRQVGSNNNAGRAQMLNWAAYARAIGNLQLERGLELANESIKLVNSEQRMALLDTRGFLYYRLQRYPEALTDMNLAIREVEDEYAAWKQKHSQEVFRLAEADYETRFTFRNWAVIYYHRGLVYQALEKTEEAEADFKQVREWGFEPNEELY